MAELNALSTEDRVAIDRVFERLSGRTHYEVLAAAVDASWDAIDQAARDLRKRMDPSRFVGIPSGEYQRRIEAVLRAIDQATEVLGDPVRRFLYDQQLRRSNAQRGETPPPPRPAMTPIPPRPIPAVAQERGSWSPEPSTPGLASAAPLVVPAPLRKDLLTGSGGGRAPNARAASARPSAFPPPLDGGRTPPAPAPPVATSTDRLDVDVLLVEVERIAVSVQFCIAQILDPQASRVSALQTAGQALADTRAALAAVQARRDEEAGRWAEATNHWIRAARAKPNDAAVLTRLAESHHRNGDLASAEDAVRRALAIDPNREEARAVLASLGRR